MCLPHTALLLAKTSVVTLASFLVHEDTSIFLGVLPLTVSSAWVSVDLTFSMRPPRTNKINTTCPSSSNSDPSYSVSGFFFPLFKFGSCYFLIHKIIF